MIKKISIILIISFILASCGKKGDPVYNEENQNSEVFNTQKILLI